MNFVSLQFFLIVVCTVVLYFLCPRKYRWYILLVSSCYFYVNAAGKRALVLAVSTVIIAFYSALWIEKSDEKRKKKLFLSLGIVALLGILAITRLKKYAFMDIAWIIVPLGVSYYTLSIVGYLVDVYSKKQKAEHNFLKLLLFTLYFPKIVQGPFSKYRELGPRLIESHPLDYNNFCFGLQRIVWGYFKKLVIVERAALLTGNIFNGNIENYQSGGAVLLFATFIATISHYCDFSGYMDIVIGISQVMGIELDENFRQPFFSKSAAEFWRRWHITLGTWFKDYVYMPLVINPKVIRISKIFRDKLGKRAGRSVMTIIPLATVWIMTGLWHGTGLDYMIWGCYWGCIIIISDVFSPELKKLPVWLHIKTDAKDWEIFQMLRTFCIFTGGLTISTFVGIRQLKLYVWYIVKSFGIRRMSFATLNKLGLSKTNFWILTAAILLLWVVEVKQLNTDVRMEIAKLNGITRWFIYAMLALIVVFFGVYGPGYSTKGFAYANF